MIIVLHTGPKSAPEMALFDTTGISVTRSVAPTYKADAPTAVGFVTPDGVNRHCGRPDRDWGMFKGGALVGKFDETLAAWEAAYAARLAEFEQVKTKWEDNNYRNAAVWHGPRLTVDHEGNEIDLATFVHETPEEIAALMGVAAKPPAVIIDNLPAHAVADLLQLVHDAGAFMDDGAPPSVWDRIDRLTRLLDLAAK